MSDIRSLALSRAYELVEAGKPDEARTVLEPILLNDRDNADAWWIYAYAVNDPVEARHALENVLRINPSYPGAAELMANLENQYPDMPPKPDIPAAAVPPDIPEAETGFYEDEPFVVDETYVPPVLPPGKQKRRNWLPLAIVAGIIALLFLILALILPGLGGSLTPATATAEQIALDITPLPTSDMIVPPITEEIETLEVAIDETLITPEETEISLPVVATIGGAPTSTEAGAATSEVTLLVETEIGATTEAATETAPIGLEAATETGGEIEASPSAAPDETVATLEVTLLVETEIGATTEAATETAPIGLEAATETGGEIEATPSAAPEETAAIAETETPTIEETTESLVEATGTEAALPTEEGVIEGTAETAAPEETLEIPPKPEATAQTADDYAAQIIESLQVFTVAQPALEEMETSVGTTLVARVCSQEGPDLHTTLPAVMNTMAEDADQIPAEFDSIGARMINCDKDMTLRLIVVDRAYASAYNAGELTQSEFEALWISE